MCIKMKISRTFLTLFGGLLLVLVDLSNGKYIISLPIKAKPAQTWTGILQQQQPHNKPGASFTPVNSQSPVSQSQISDNGVMAIQQPQTISLPPAFTSQGYSVTPLTMVPMSEPSSLNSIDQHHANSAGPLNVISSQSSVGSSQSQAVYTQSTVDGEQLVHVESTGIPQGPPLNEGPPLTPHESQVAPTNMESMHSNIQPIDFPVISPDSIQQPNNPPAVEEQPYVPLLQPSQPPQPLPENNLFSSSQSVAAITSPVQSAPAQPPYGVAQVFEEEPEDDMPFDVEQYLAQASLVLGRPPVASNATSNPIIPASSEQNTQVVATAPSQPPLSAPVLAPNAPENVQSQAAEQLPPVAPIIIEAVPQANLPIEQSPVAPIIIEAVPQANLPIEQPPAPASIATQHAPEAVHVQMEQPLELVPIPIQATPQLTLPIEQSSPVPAPIIAHNAPETVQITAQVIPEAMNSQVDAIPQSQISTPVNQQDSLNSASLPVILPNVNPNESPMSSIVSAFGDVSESSNLNQVNNNQNANSEPLLLAPEESETSDSLGPNEETLLGSLTPFKPPGPVASTILENVDSPHAQEAPILPQDAPLQTPPSELNTGLTQMSQLSAQTPTGNVANVPSSPNEISSVLESVVLVSPSPSSDPAPQPVPTSESILNSQSVQTPPVTLTAPSSEQTFEIQQNPQSIQPSNGFFNYQPAPEQTFEIQQNPQSIQPSNGFLNYQPAPEQTFEIQQNPQLIQPSNGFLNYQPAPEQTFEIQQNPQSIQPSNGFLNYQPASEQTFEIQQNPQSIQSSNGFLNYQPESEQQQNPQSIQPSNGFFNYQPASELTYEIQQNPQSNQPSNGVFNYQPASEQTFEITQNVQPSLDSQQPPPSLQEVSQVVPAFLSSESGPSPSNDISSAVDTVISVSSSDPLPVPKPLPAYESIEISEQPSAYEPTVLSQPAPTYAESALAPTIDVTTNLAQVSYIPPESAQTSSSVSVELFSDNSIPIVYHMESSSLVGQETDAGQYAVAPAPTPTGWPASLTVEHNTIAASQEIVAVEEEEEAEDDIPPFDVEQYLAQAALLLNPNKPIVDSSMLQQQAAKPPQSVSNNEVTQTTPVLVQPASFTPQQILTDIGDSLMTQSNIITNNIVGMLQPNQYQNYQVPSQAPEVVGHTNDASTPSLLLDIATGTMIEPEAESLHAELQSLSVVQEGTQTDFAHDTTSESIDPSRLEVSGTHSNLVVPPQFNDILNQHYNPTVDVPSTLGVSDNNNNNNINPSSDLLIYGHHSTNPVSNDLHALGQENYDYGLNLQASPVLAVPQESHSEAALLSLVGPLPEFPKKAKEPKTESNEKRTISKPASIIGRPSLAGIAPVYTYSGGKLNMGDDLTYVHGNVATLASKSPSFNASQLPLNDKGKPLSPNSMLAVLTNTVYNSYLNGDKKPTIYNVPSLASFVMSQQHPSQTQSNKPQSSQTQSNKPSNLNNSLSSSASTTNTTSSNPNSMNNTQVYQHYYFPEESVRNATIAISNGNLKPPVGPIYLPLEESLVPKLQSEVHILLDSPNTSYDTEPMKLLEDQREAKSQMNLNLVKRTTTSEQSQEEEISEPEGEDFEKVTNTEPGSENLPTAAETIQFENEVLPAIESVNPEVQNEIEEHPLTNKNLLPPEEEREIVSSVLENVPNPSVDNNKMFTENLETVAETVQEESPSKEEFEKVKNPQNPHSAASSPPQETISSPPKETSAPPKETRPPPPRESPPASNGPMLPPAPPPIDLPSLPSPIGIPSLAAFAIPEPPTLVVAPAPPVPGGVPDMADAVHLPPMPQSSKVQKPQDDRNPSSNKHISKGSPGSGGRPNTPNRRPQPQSKPSPGAPELPKPAPPPAQPQQQPQPSQPQQQPQPSQQQPQSSQQQPQSSQQQPQSSQLQQQYEPEIQNMVENDYSPVAQQATPDYDNLEDAQDEPSHTGTIEEVKLEVTVSHTEKTIPERQKPKQPMSPVAPLPFVPAKTTEDCPCRDSSKNSNPSNIGNSYNPGKYNPETNSFNGPVDYGIQEDNATAPRPARPYKPKRPGRPSYSNKRPKPKPMDKDLERLIEKQADNGDVALDLTLLEEDSEPYKINIFGWEIPIPSWSRFTELFISLFGNNFRTNSGEFTCDENVDRIIALRSELDVDYLCGGGDDNGRGDVRSLDSNICNMFCSSNGFASGICIPQKSCLCYISEDKNFAIKLDRLDHYNNTVTAVEEKAPASEDVAESGCQNCRCLKSCQSHGKYIGYCSKSCHCGVPWYNEQGRTAWT